MWTSLWDNLHSKWAFRHIPEKYRPVPHDDDGGDDDNSSDDVNSTATRAHSSLLVSQTARRRRVNRRFPSLSQLLNLSLSVALIILAGLYTHLRLHMSQPVSVPLRCGKSIEEAQSRGCVFDTLSKAWLPAACPVYGLDEYLAAGVAASNITGHTQPWPFYLDKQATQEISVLEMSQMASAYKSGEEFWTSDREHVTHCAWMLIRMAHAYKTGQRLDSNSDHFEHNQHCSLFLLRRALEAPGIDEIRVRGNVIFGGC